MKNTLLLKIAPPFLIVVVVGIILNITSKYLGITEQLEAEHFIQLPSLETASSLFIWNKLNFANFLNTTVWMQAAIIAIVASLMVISALLNGFVLFSSNTATAQVICSDGPAIAMRAF